MGFFAAPMVLAVTAVSVDAQQMDQRWLPFLGCWEPVDAEAEAGLVCVGPFEEGIEILGVASGEVVSRDVMVADGVMRALSGEECDASEAVDFSADGWRVFSHSEFRCEGDVSQSGSGVISLVAPTQWMDVRSIQQGDEEVAWVQRYILVGPDRIAAEGVDDPTADAGMSVRNARMMAASGIDLEDVEEASGRVDAKAVEAWVAATRDRFEVTAEDLIRLSDAGVPESVIDVVVAVSFPERFAIDAEGAAMAQQREGRGAPARAYSSYGFRSPFWSPYFGYSYGYGYSPFGYAPIGYGYGYGSPFGSGYSPYYGYTTRVEVTTRSARRGRLVNGRGYRGTSGGSGSARPGGSGSGDSSAAPSSGSSGGSGSTPKRRTAKRRPPGG
jgi:hypothetical protein